MINPRKILVIHNPNAGQKTTHLFLGVIDRLRALRAEVEVIKTQYAGHAQIIAHEHKDGDFDIICAAGGDGTLNEVLNGLYPSAMQVGIIPLGTANVMAKELNIKDCPDAISATLLGDQSKDCWLGHQGTRYFSLMVSVGTDAKTVDNVNLALKKRLGKTAYALSFLNQILFYRPIAYEITVDGISYPAGAAIVTRGKYYGGKFICAPQADLCKKEFHIVLMVEKNRWQGLCNVVKMILNRIPLDKDVKIVVGQRVTIQSDKPAKYQIDGDKGGSLPLALTLSHKTVAIMCG